MITALKRKPKNKTKRRSTKRRITRPLETLENRQLMAADIGIEQPTDTPAVISTVANNATSSQSSISSTAADGFFGNAGTSQTIDNAASELVEQMKSTAAQTGRVVLDAFDEFATFAGITIEAPSFEADGSVNGTTQFGDSAAPVLLQYISATGTWALAIETEIPDLVPADTGFQSPVELQSPYLVFSTATVDIEHDEMSTGSKEFYGRLYESDDFTVRLQRGVNLLSRATIAEDSTAGDILGIVGLDIPAVELEGVVLRDFDSDTIETFKQARHDSRFWDQFRKQMMLRATLPEINLDGLPPNMTTGGAYLVWESPGTDQDQIYAALDLLLHQENDLPVRLTGRAGFADTPTGSELRISATAANINDAFGVTGLDLQQVTMLLDVDTIKKPVAGDKVVAKSPTAAVPTVGLGIAANMEIGGRDVMIAGKVELNTLTGAPMKVALRGELSSLSSLDLIRFANRLSGLDAVNIDESGLPNFELRSLVINIAPLGGDAQLGIEDGIGLAGELYVNDRLIAKVDGSIDRTGVVPKIRLTAWTDKIDLGALSVSDVNVDILMTQSVDDYFIVKGTVAVLGASHSVDIHLAADRMHYRIATEVNGLGMVDYAFESKMTGTPYWTFLATVRNDASAQLEQNVANNARAWATEASASFQKAQNTLDAAQAEVNKLIKERNDAIADAQKDFDEFEAKLQKAEESVRTLRSRLSSWIRSERSAYSRYRSAVSSRRAAKWYQYAGRRAVELSRYATYVGIRSGRYAVQGSLRVAENVLREVKEAASFTLDLAGPEAHPEVIRITAELAVKTAALQVAKAAVTAAEAVSTGAADVVAFAAEHHDDLFMIDRIHFQGTLSAAIANTEFDLEIDYRFLNQAKKIDIDIALSDLSADDLIERLFDEIRD